MTDAPLDPVFRAALRDELVRQVRHAPPRRRYRGRLTVGFVLAIGAAGGGIAVATDPAPLPGTDRVTLKSAPATAVHTGSATVDLGRRPRASTNVELTLTCLTGGTFAFADGASLICTPDDVADGRTRGTATYTLALPPGQTRTTITTAPTARWSLITAYSQHQPVPLAANSKGDTYGASTDRGTPDLIAAIATNGRTGYVYAKDLDSPEFTSPAQALAWQRKHANQHRTIPVYTSDGHTVIGKFVIG